MNCAFGGGDWDTEPCASCKPEDPPIGSLFKAKDDPSAKDWRSVVTWSDKPVEEGREDEFAETFERASELDKREDDEREIVWPAHYTYSSIQPIDAIEAWDLPHSLACCVKYIARAQHKGAEEQDLRKARWYLNRHLNRYFGK